MGHCLCRHQKCAWVVSQRQHIIQQRFLVLGTRFRLSHISTSNSVIHAYTPSCKAFQYTITRNRTCGTILGDWMLLARTAFLCWQVCTRLNRALGGLPAMRLLPPVQPSVHVSSCDAATMGRQHFTLMLVFMKNGEVHAKWLKEAARVSSRQDNRATCRISCTTHSSFHTARQTTDRCPNAL